jgi:hypothetical protein
MSQYTPDKWEMVRINSKEHGQIDKVFGTWHGGFAGSDNWRFSSGVTNVSEHDHFYEVDNESGSVYVCYKQARGTNSYTHGVLLEFQEAVKEQGDSMEIIDVKELLK